jgi:hypothetical protein
MLDDLWQNIVHGKQRRTPTRSQKAQEKTTEARGHANCDAPCVQASRSEALVIQFTLTPPLASTFSDGFRTLNSPLSHEGSCRGKFWATQTMRFLRFIPVATILLLALALCVGSPADEKTVWKSVVFAIVKFNDEAPKSWNIYHTEKKGLLLVHLWKRYLFVDMKEEEVYEVDPQTVIPHGDDVEWSTSDIPAQPLDVSEWKERNVGQMERVTFRLGKGGHILELQIPLKPDGKPAY